MTHDLNAATDLVFAFRGAELVIHPEAAALPGPEAIAAIAPIALSRHALGDVAGRACWALELPPDAALPENLGPIGLRALFGRLDEATYAMAGRAAQVLTWHRDHRFCGRCGAPTASGDTPLAKVCPGCGAHHFPRLSPAVIVAVRRGDRVLLARAPHFAPGMFSTVAGFVEPGETLEEAVAREVREEVGIEVENVRYFGSQPWPYPHSLMIGFTAQWAGGELTPDAHEIVAADWFAVDAMPVVPGRLSIARALIDDFVRGQGGDPTSLRSP